MNALPAGFLDCGARGLHRLLDGPTLFELEGRREPPLFVSILLHGNEDSGLGAVQRVMSRYSGRTLPRSLILLVGNVEAARRGLRRLDSQPDYNRIWPGTAHDIDTPEARLMGQVHARVVDRGAIAALDFHNNTGRNPHYAVISSVDPDTLGLAALFARRVVCFHGIAGTQTASFEGLMPAVTAECGLPHETANAEAAARFLDAALDAAILPSAPEPQGLELYHTLGVVRVKEDVSFGFDFADADVRFDPGLDQNNFRQLQPGVILGETRQRMPLQMIDESGRDVAEEFFASRCGKLTLLRKAVPAMFTADPRIVRQDCLGYLMERIDRVEVR